MVGFDVELVNQLAKDLDITLSLIRIKNKADEAKLLKDGSIDMIIGGNSITPMRAINVAFTDPYTFHTAGILVNDAKRNEFSDLYAIQTMKTLNLGVGGSKYYQEVTREFFPNAKITEVNNVRLFLKGKYKDVDALIYSTEAGSAWAMLYPNFSAIIPKHLQFRAPVAFVLPK
jgi:ABC-type amino acid transport substrate-binding protein